MADKTYPHCFDFTPAQVKVLPMYPGQSKVLKNGDVKCWFTEAQWCDVCFLVNAINDGESNIYQEAHNEVADEYQLVL